MSVVILLDIEDEVPTKTRGVGMSEAKQIYTADEAYKLLQLGNSRRLASMRKNLENPSIGQKYKEMRDKLQVAQHPFAVLVSCSDSRFPPEIIFNNREGDLFVVRTAGHVIENDAAGSIEYAVEHLGVPLIVVMGHDKCGAVTTAVNHSDVHGHIFNVIEHIYPAVKQTAQSAGDHVSEAINQHVRNTVEYIRELEPICKSYVEQGKLRVLGARCKIDTNEVEWL